MMRRVLTVLVLAVVAAPPAAAAQERVARSREVTRRVEATTTSGQERERQSRQGRNDERESQTDRTTRTLNIGANGELELVNIAGDITITRGGGTTAALEIVKTARAATADEARQMLALVPVDVTERGTRAEVRTRYPNSDELRRGNRRNINVSVAYTLAAPEGTRILAKSISGSISVRDILGGVTLETISGNVRIANAGRTASGRTISGDIELFDTKVDGALEVGTISGSIRLRRLTARSVALNSVSGDLQLDDITAERVTAQVISADVLFSGTLAPNGRYELTSHSGNVRVAIPASSSFEVEATSFSGSINTDIPITMSGGQNGRRSRALRGTAGGGGAVLDLTTFSGSIAIVKR